MQRRETERSKRFDNNPGSSQGRPIRWHVYGAESVIEHQHSNARLGALTQNPTERVGHPTWSTVVQAAM
jgi:hypothetical protein